MSAVINVPNANQDGGGIWTDLQGNQLSAYDAGGVTSVSPSLSTGAAWLQTPVYIAAGVGLLLGVGGMYAYSKRKK
jgi:LPXTG-motif cell wall-anchored protein